MIRSLWVFSATTLQPAQSLLTWKQSVTNCVIEALCAVKHKQCQIAWYMEYIYIHSYVFHSPNHLQWMHHHMPERSRVWQRDRVCKQSNRGWVCTVHTSQTKYAQNTDTSSNCIQWIIKLHELHHSCPDDREGGEGMRCGRGLNARRVPMQFHLIKNQGPLCA